MSFNGDLYPEAGASVVMTTKGDMVDYNTSRQRLGIGSTNQILQVTAGGLPAWQTLSTAGSVLTTQGDVLIEGGAGLARLGQSTDNYTLATKGAGANPAWQASATSVLTTTGDLLYASGANTLARLAGGTSGDVLTANGAGVAPSYQTTGGGATITRTTVDGADHNQTTTSTTLEDVQGTTSMTLTNVAGGGAFANFQWIGECSARQAHKIAIEIDGTDTGMNETKFFDEEITTMYVSVIAPTDGTVLQERWAVGSGTGTLYNTATRSSDMIVMEVS